MSDPIPQVSAILAQLDAGCVNDVLSADLAELVQAVQSHDKPGRLTIVLNIEPAGSGARTVQVTEEHTVKMPKARPSGSIMFVGDKGALSKTDPYQQTIPGANR